MSAPAVYLLLPGTAREALGFYRDVFGGTLELATYEEMGRGDGPGHHIGHGVLSGAVTLFASDAGPGEAPVAVDGLMLTLLGTADEATLRRWFDGLSAGGDVVEPLAERPWGAYDGQVVDRYGLRWLVGWEPGSA